MRASFFIFWTLASLAAQAQPAFVEFQRWDAPEARQAVAVDAAHFYAIGNAEIAKYDKQSGQRIARWRAAPEFPLTHLNSGLVPRRQALLRSFELPANAGS